MLTTATKLETDSVPLFL